MPKQPRFTVYHDIDLHDICVHISIEWDYYPGIPQTYHDPEEFPSVDLISVNVPDELEYRKEEIEWVAEDQRADLEVEALENIHEQFERQEVIGNEYA
jgi:hypothetical protein